MKKDRNCLLEYLVSDIFPRYKYNDEGHQLDHIFTVMRRSNMFAEQVKDQKLNMDMVDVVAAYHDLGCAVDRSRHEKISAEIFMGDAFMSEYFTEDERKIIAEAIEDHRASGKSEPRSIYGKIVSTADRNNSFDDYMVRIWHYNRAKHPEYTVMQVIEDMRQHSVEKFGRNGYARHKIFFADPSFEKMCDMIDYATRNMETYLIEVHRVLPEINLEEEGC